MKVILANLAKVILDLLAESRNLARLKKCEICFTLQNTEQKQKALSNPDLAVIQVYLDEGGPMFAKIVPELIHYIRMLIG